MILIPEQILEDIKEYPEKLKAHLEGKIEAERFKPYRVGLGIYEQRDNDTYMIRSRVPSGLINIEQLKKVVELADQYSHGQIHLTTRQDIQFHKVTIEDTEKIMKGLIDVGIMTRGTGGNTVRNVVCSPLSGVEAGEVFDVTVDAVKTTEYLLEDPTAFQLPRKYKIGYSNSEADTANASFSDLGFIAKEQEGVLGYRVYGGGGLGGKPTAALLLESFIPRSEILYYVKAMKNLFEKEGDRTNKHSARIRFIRYRLGEEEFVARVKEEVALVKEATDLSLDVPIEERELHVGEQTTIHSPILTEQKQKGLYALYIHPTNGNLAVADLTKVIQFIEALDYSPSIRFTNTQGFYVRDLTGPDAEKLLGIVSEFVSEDSIDHSVACAGASTCKLGLCLSQNFLSAVVSHFESVDKEIKSQLPALFISGCPNSCGQHQKGKIGFSGKAKRTEKGLIPYYTLYFNGEVGLSPALGEAFGDLPAKKIPAFLYDLAVLKKDLQIDDFSKFLDEAKEKVEQLIEKYNDIDIKEDALYYDFGSEMPFSLKGRGPGECSAGVLDVIKLDLSNAEAYLKEYEQKKEADKLYQAGVSASRALLVLKGVDSSKERVIFNAFKTHYIETGWVKQEIEEVLDTLIDYKLGDIESLDEIKEDIAYLSTRVRDLFASLSPQLELTLEKEWLPEEGGANEAVDTSEDVNVIDFRGVKCPINFVKVKIELSKVASGAELGFYLDDGEPIVNVPKSVEAEGHQVVEIDTSYDGYNLLVVKKK